MRKIFIYFIVLTFMTGQTSAIAQQNSNVTDCNKDKTQDTLEENVCKGPGGDSIDVANMILTGDDSAKEVSKLVDRIATNDPKKCNEYGMKDNTFDYKQSIFAAYSQSSGNFYTKMNESRPELGIKYDKNKTHTALSNKIATVTPEQQDYLVKLENVILNKTIEYETLKGKKCDGDKNLTLNKQVTDMKVFFNSEAEATAYLSNKDAQMQNLQFCKGPTTLPKGSKDPLSKKSVYLNCGDMKNLYEDNGYKFDQTKSSEKTKLDECLAKAKNMGGKIVSVQIESSASMLYNTGDIATEGSENYCGRNSYDGGFLALSQKRAEEMKKYIDNNIPKDNDPEYSLNYWGQNGDGSSGPDPHKYKTDKYGNKVLDKKGQPISIGLLPGYEKGGEKRPDLDKNKYVKVHIKVDVETPSPPLTIDKYYVTCETWRIGCVGTKKDSFDSDHFDNSSGGSGPKDKSNSGNFLKFDADIVECPKW